MDQGHFMQKFSRPVAVIGAGVSGLVTARRLVAEGFEVDVFERRSLAGGLWNFSPAANAPFASAVYADLRTNFPRQLMELQDYPWTTQPLFMQHDLVREYLEGYAQEIQHESYGLLRINFNTQVVRLLYERCAGGYWELTCKSVITGQSATRRYPYVVVAVGVFDEPLIPSYEGLSEWKKIRENSLSHAKEYRDPKTFKGKNVLIIGYQASGFDITNKITAYVSKLWISSTQKIRHWKGKPSNVTLMTEISCFIPETRTVHFTNGESISEVDQIILCTGYQYHQPFIKGDNNSEAPLFPTGNSISGLHEHVISIKQPSLAFVGLLRGAVPTFLVAQAQAAFISRVFAGRIRLSSLTEASPQHRMPYPKFMDYLLRLERLCEQADKGRTWQVGKAKIPAPRWTAELDLVMTRRNEIRGAFLSTGGRDDPSLKLPCHRQFLSLSCPNVEALVPFLILHYGYRRDHDTMLDFPFHCWQVGSAYRLIMRIKEMLKTMIPELGQDSQAVFVRGARTLLPAILNKWLVFYRSLSDEVAIMKEHKDMDKAKIALQEIESYFKTLGFGSSN
ncbi:hypothetical protein J7T55_013232 [Diaporthe amygdali]|uniref:uncharacterized protein n=1 Tax=Phomopsis amygdali TaxID=1214568 RepID=UPI0022FEEBAC|nr:uncharacterized protein J7T55_013232 [Diaporthe amygdali]KAJ0118997.1 hypothetical protein J7T55_013232 [Diaporthe amygdali]